eukprot:TRINITY_DN3195_c0_g1_i1.p1 TRINITY_DN3195_c0_g1~~TRINITY_DN3195_c0_g1_i1.p1  ORF type:complete len:350 (+),score=97.96 TRINITY_DN3195_c0_g1_i1:22-1050(+)
MFTVSPAVPASPPLALGIRKVAAHVLAVTDVARSLRFYCDTLGLQTLRPTDLAQHRAWLVIGGVEIHLIQGTPAMSRKGTAQVPHLSLKVDDILAAREALHVAGISSIPHVELTPDVPSSFTLQLFIRDPDGYAIAFTQAVPFSAAANLIDLCYDRQTWSVKLEELVQKLSEAGLPLSDPALKGPLADLGALGVRQITRAVLVAVLTGRKEAVNAEDPEEPVVAEPEVVEVVALPVDAPSAGIPVTPEPPAPPPPYLAQPWIRRPTGHYVREENASTRSPFSHTQSVRTAYRALETVGGNPWVRGPYGDYYPPQQLPTSAYNLGGKTFIREADGTFVIQVSS